ncbi:MAG: hypothetical protein OEX97_12845 [Acidimicrobiia bacterium]|nr:hypothetical protein [Acidimicrobiia bacterium]
MRPVVPGTEENLAASAAAPIPGTTGPQPCTPRRSAQPRPWVRPHLYERDEPILYTHRYVRSAWTAVLGPQAVADLLRLIRAAEQGRRIRRPVRLQALVAVGLAVWAGGELFVSTHLPPVPAHLVRRHHPGQPSP